MSAAQRELSDHRFANAERLLGRALNIARENFGSRDRRVAQTLLELADLFEEKSETMRCVDSLIEASKIYEENQDLEFHHITLSRIARINGGSV